MTKRILCWFSCGAASAVATKLAIADNAEELPLVIAYTEVIEEHPDNKRFLAECQEWFGQEIIILGNDKYKRSVREVFSRSGFLKGPHGAPCTGILKKRVRKDFEMPTDRQVFGYTAEEQVRVDRFIDRNNDVDIWVPLIDRGLLKSDVLAMVDNAGIDLPEMYKLGYRNNNCIGCVKGEAGYWNKIRVDFPETFEWMAQTEERIGATVCKIEWTEDGERKRKRVSLRDLPPDAGHYPSEPDISCGIFCSMAEKEIEK